MNKLNQFKYQQQGSTLLEVLVSVFVLGFGLLALVSMQLKTVMTTREAENQTIVAQAADTLIESMLLNPNLNLVDLGGGEKMMQRNFEAYRSAGTIAAGCVQDAKLTSNATSGLSKEELAQAHLCTFVKRINQIPNTGKVYWNICMETPTTATDKPVLSSGATPTIQCGAGAGATTTVLKVVWEQELEEASKYADSGLTLNEAGTAVLYSYQTPISQ